MDNQERNYLRTRPPTRAHALTPILTNVRTVGQNERGDSGGLEGSPRTRDPDAINECVASSITKGGLALANVDLRGCEERVIGASEGNGGEKEDEERAQTQIRHTSISTSLSEITNEAKS